MKCDTRWVLMIIVVGIWGGCVSGQHAEGDTADGIVEEQNQTQPATIAEVDEARVLYRKMIDAYTQVQQYQVVKSMEMSRGGKVTMAGRLIAGMDRATNRFAVKTHDMQIVSDGRYLMVKLATIKNKYLQREIEGDLNLAMVMQAMPFVGGALILWPDMELMLGGSLISDEDQLKLGEDDESGRKQLRIVRQGRAVTLWLDEQSSLVEKATVIVGGQTQGERVVVETVMETAGYNQKIDARFFDLDVVGSQPVSEFEELINGGIVLIEGALVGQQAAGVELKTNDGMVVDLSKADMLLFWVDKSGPCKAMMMAVKELDKQWKAQGREIKVVAVNVKDSLESAAGVWSKWMMPGVVVSDEGGQSKKAYQVMQVPKVVMLKDGVIVKEFVGMREGVEREIGETVEGMR